MLKEKKDCLEKKVSTGISRSYFFSLGLNLGIDGRFKGVKLKNRWPFQRGSETNGFRIGGRIIQTPNNCSKYLQYHPTNTFSNPLFHTLSSLAKHTNPTDRE